MVQIDEVKNGMGIALIIPTRNRPNHIIRLVKNLEILELKPTFVIIVDSSDQDKIVNISSKTLEIINIRTDIKSAAIQRNIGIEYLQTLSLKKTIEFISFLDDDIQVQRNYFNLVLENFKVRKEFVGISGIAKSGESSTQRIKKTRLTNFIGITGDPGTLTSAAVNISPHGIEEFSDVDWLIGCSTWRIHIFHDLRFERDFLGQSLFEDVIFSARAKKFGKLGLDPSISIFHELAGEGRDSQKEHYASWVKNRYRIYDYNILNISKLKFWILIGFLFFYHSLISPFKAHELDKSAGILLGIKRIIQEKITL